VQRVRFLPSIAFLNFYFLNRPTLYNSKFKLFAWPDILLETWPSNRRQKGYCTSDRVIVALIGLYLKEKFWKLVSCISSQVGQDFGQLEVFQWYPKSPNLVTLSSVHIYIYVYFLHDFNWKCSIKKTCVVFSDPLKAVSYDFAKEGQFKFQVIIYLTILKYVWIKSNVLRAQLKWNVASILLQSLFKRVKSELFWYRAHRSVLTSFA